MVLADDDVEGQTEAGPCGEMVDLGVVLARRIVRDAELLNAAIGPVQGEDEAVGTHAQGMDTVEPARLGAEPAELRLVAPLAVQNDDAVIVEPVRHQHPAVGQEGDILGPAEMGLIVAADVLLAQRHDQLAAVIGQHEYLVPGLVDYPHPAFRIVRADPYPVGTGAVRIGAQVVPLIPHFDQVAVAVDHHQAVLPGA